MVFLGHLFSNYLTLLVYTIQVSLNATLFLRIPTFQVSRDEAEAILANAKEGEFLLSQDISSERFISVWYVMWFHVLWS